ncbi:DUF2188 domain-containing protein [Jeotgalibacillus aurantiacus]|uniref:hypothetical protein n=1 Tax=Jeotgalibacillus aurantiacus TaxID=2763266 RepID=UPI001D0AA207|nr:hypothetical protein [Jeotgalibacillus aurantiacus]
MPWNKNDYPDSWKNLEPAVRNKAIEIGNALVEEEGYEEGRAIAIATDRAKKSIQQGDQDTYEIRPHEDGWQLIKEGSHKAIYKEETKSALEDKAKSYVTDHNGILKVLKADGSVEQTLYKT